MDALDIFGVALAVLATCWAAYEAGHRRGTTEMWRTFGGMMEFLIESQDAADEDDEFEIDDALDEMGDCLVDASWREHVADRLTEWQQEQAA